MSHHYDYDPDLDGPAQENMGSLSDCMDSDEGDYPYPELKVEPMSAPESAAATTATDSIWSYGTALIKLNRKLFGAMTEPTFSLTAQRYQVATFSDSKCKVTGTIAIPDGTVRVGGVVIGVLAPDCRLTKLQDVNLNIDTGYEFKCSRTMEDNTDKLTLVGVGPGAQDTSIELSDYTGNTAVMRHHGKKSFVSAKQLTILKDAITAQGYRHIEEKLGLSQGSAAAAFTFNIGVINVFNCVDPDQLRTTDVDLMEALFAAKPEIKQRFRFAPDVKSPHCNGLFFCDPASSVWLQVHNAYVEDQLTLAFLQDSTLSTADERFIKTQRSGEQLRKILVRKVLDRTFAVKLDANLDLFAVDNGVFWLQDGVVKGFRATTPDDMVATTTGWKYNVSEGRAMRGAVENFLEQVFPLEEERRVVLSYVAHLMSGRRSAKKFLVLTDKRAGNNGKSTFASLLMLFFGPLSKSSTKFVCKGSFDKDKDSHDGGLEGFKGKRLLVAEELKHTMTLDDAMLKGWTGGGKTHVQGRKMGSSETFSFAWQAGFILIFNEGDCPKFDPADQAFMERMIVAPMRSKFVAEVAQDAEPFTYPMDIAIETKFESWLSAFADVLMQYQDKRVLLNVPASMSQWRQDVMEGANPLAEWLMERVEVTGVQSDRIKVADLKKLHISESASHKNLPHKDFPKMARAYLEALPGVVYKPTDRVDGRPEAGVMRGLRLRDSIPDHLA